MNKAGRETATTGRLVSQQWPKDLLNLCTFDVPSCKLGILTSAILSICLCLEVQVRGRPHFPPQKALSIYPKFYVFSYLAIFKISERYHQRECQNCETSESKLKRIMRFHADTLGEKGTGC